MQRFRVFATARNVATLQDLENQGVETCPLDVCNEASVKNCVERVQTAASKIDVLIANAGIISMMPLIDQPISDIKNILDTNVLGVVRVIQVIHLQQI